MKEIASRGNTEKPVNSERVVFKPGEIEIASEATRNQ